MSNSIKCQIIFFCSKQLFFFFCLCLPLCDIQFCLLRIVEIFQRPLASVARYASNWCYFHRITCLFCNTWIMRLMIFIPTPHRRLGNSKENIQSRISYIHIASFSGMYRSSQWIRYRSLDSFLRSNLTFISR